MGLSERYDAIFGVKLDSVCHFNFFFYRNNSYELFRWLKLWTAVTTVMDLPVESALSHQTWFVSPVM